MARKVIAASERRRKKSRCHVAKAKKKRERERLSQKSGFAGRWRKEGGRGLLGNIKIAADGAGMNNKRGLFLYYIY